MGLAKNAKAKDKTTKNTKAVHTTVQQSIPYIAAYSNGIIQTKPGYFSKSYALEDINFRTADEGDQENLFSRFCDLLNSFSDADIEITCVNKTVDEERFKEKHCLSYKGDSLDNYRKEINDILIGNLEGGTSIEPEKYLTLTIRADNIDVAAHQFGNLDDVVINAVHGIGGAVATPMKAKERLEILHDIMHPGNTTEAFDCDFDKMRKSGITTKDIIAPSSMKFVKDKMEIGDKVACSLFLVSLPTTLSTEFFAELGEIPCNLALSYHLSSVSQDKALKIVRNQMTNINANILEQQKKASQRGYMSNVVSPDLEAAKEEAESLLDDITKRNQRLFYSTLVVTVFADNDEDLAKFTKIVQVTGQRHVCTMKKLSYQQEQGLGTSLPLGNNCLDIKRLLTTEAAGLFIPFSAESLCHENGLYYGLNAISRSMILFNRLNSKNANGVILGTPGSGKSFSAKREMLSVLLGTDADLYIIDPEGEYTPLAQMLGGEVIRIAAGSETYINPLDMDMRYADDDDPVTLKADFLCSICETAIGGRYGLSPVQKSIIDRCVRDVYKPYLEYMASHPELTSAPEHCPTLVDFYEKLLAQPEPEAISLALSLELYCVGSFNIFAKKTNVNIKSRFVVYNIKDVGTNLKELGLQVCLNDIWNRTIANKSKNKRTWFYLDEFYLLTQTPSSAEFLQQIYKRSRKWGGVPTGITQNVEDLLRSTEARSILNNCDFVMMLNQAPLDREQLSELLHISPSLQQYITNVEPGHGLLYTGKTMVPFVDNYPRDTETFKVMTTNPNDLKG